MPRLPRYGLPGQPQHVIQRGNSRAAIFARAADYRHFRDYLAVACAEQACAVHAYVLMTNHVHLLMTPATAGAIGRVMQSVGRRYVPYFNWSRGRTGGLYEGRFRATPIDTEEYMLRCYRYIERNPVRAGLVNDPADYPWSSYRANALGERDPLISPHDLYSRLGKDASTRRAAYRSLHDEELDESALVAIRKASHTGWALGSDQFRDEITRRSRRRAAPLPRGGHPCSSR
jgi:putative transposase